MRAGAATSTAATGGWRLSWRPRQRCPAGRRCAALRCASIFYPCAAPPPLSLCFAFSSPFLFAELRVSCVALPCARARVPAITSICAPPLSLSLFLSHSLSLWSASPFFHGGGLRDEGRAAWEGRRGGLEGAAWGASELGLSGLGGMRWKRERSAQGVGHSCWHQCRVGRPRGPAPPRACAALPDPCPCPSALRPSRECQACSASRRSHAARPARFPRGITK